MHKRPSLKCACNTDDKAEYGKGEEVICHAKKTSKDVIKFTTGRHGRNMDDILPCAYLLLLLSYIIYTTVSSYLAF